MNFADKTRVIAQLWIEFRKDEDWKSFFDYNDLGSPMAYMVTQGLIKDLTPLGEEMISETLNMFLKLINTTEEEVDSVVEEKDFSSILEFAYNKNEKQTPG
jgi:hypothetical protein